MIMRRVLVLTTALVLCSTPMVAHADTATTPEPDPTGIALPSAEPSADPSASTSDDTVTPGSDSTASSFDTFATAMLDYYAAQSGLGRDAFVARNATTLGAFLGVDSKTLASGGFTAEIRDQLTGSLFESVTGPMSAPEITLDTAVTLRGAKWAKDMLTLRYNTIKVPKPKVPGGKAPAKQTRSAGSEEAMFGLMYNTSMAEMVKGSPDLFAQVASAGVGSPQAAQAFKEAMARAYGKSSGDLSKMFPSPCSAAFLTALSSGSASQAQRTGGSACQPCVVSGIYAHSQMASSFAAGASAAPRDVAPTNLGSLPAWQQDIVKDQNPSLASQLSQSVGQPSGGCSSSSPAVSGTLTQALPGVFSSLRPR